MKMCESNDTRAAYSNLKAYHSAECLIDDKQEPNLRSDLRTNSYSTVKNRIALYRNKLEQPSMLRDYQRTKNLKRSVRDSFEGWISDGTDDKTGCTKTVTSVSHEELRALRGCVTRGRVLFSPKLSQETSPSVLQVLSASTSDFSREFEKIPHVSLECDKLDGNPPIADTSNSIPDSVSVQFDCTCYDSETICEPLLKEHQVGYTGLNVAAISTSECNIDKKSTDSHRQCLIDVPLSCSIPGELNTCNAQFEHRARSPGLEHGFPDQSLEFPLSHAKDNSLHSSWPCRHFCHSKEEYCATALSSCSAKHVPLLTIPHQVTQLPLPKQHSYHPIFQGGIGVKSSLSSSVDIASTLSVSSCHSVSDPTLSLSDRPHISYSNGVDGQVFKDKTEVSYKTVILHML